jgi:hypothetical protein
MFDFLFHMADVSLYILLTSVFIIVSLIAIILVRFFVPLELRYRDNGTLGNTISLISVIYAVLVGFTSLYLINNNASADAAVQHESSAAADIYRDSKWLKDPIKTNIQTTIKNYVTEVINVEWPIMQRGDEVKTREGSYLLEKITNDLIQYVSPDNSESLLLHDMLDQVRTLYDSRQERIHNSYSELSPELWVVILLGTFLTLGINYFFGMNFYLHMLTITSIAIMASSMIFLLITIDRPFQGEFAIDSSSFQSLLTYINSDQDPSSKNVVK